MGKSFLPVSFALAGCASVAALAFLRRCAPPTCVVVLLAAVAAAAPDDEITVRNADVEADVNGFGQFDFDSWMFQGSREIVQNRINATLKMQLDELDRVCNLSDEQQEKLRLAAAGDIKRFFDHADELRAEFQKNRNDQNAFGEIWPRVRKLQLRMNADFFASNSLFAKTIRRTLTAEQQSRLKELDDDRRRFRYRAAIDVAMESLVTSLPMLDEQRAKITKMLVEETPPPPRFSQYDTMYVMHQLSQLPSEKIKSLLNERQMTQLSQYLNNVRGFNIQQMNE